MDYESQYLAKSIRGLTLISKALVWGFIPIMLLFWVPLTEDEHGLFPFGFRKLGKGVWRGTWKNYVPCWNPTQLASQAQKYIISKIAEREEMLIKRI
ncbi:hypothetical protein LguiB_029274 [Lonicera macranthoides]